MLIISGLKNPQNSRVLSLCSVYCSTNNQTNSGGKQNGGNAFTDHECHLLDELKFIFDCQKSLIRKDRKHKIF